MAKKPNPIRRRLDPPVHPIKAAYDHLAALLPPGSMPRASILCESSGADIELVEGTFDELAHIRDDNKSPKVKKGADALCTALRGTWITARPSEYMLDPTETMILRKVLEMGVPMTCEDLSRQIEGIGAAEPQTMQKRVAALIRRRFLVRPYGRKGGIVLTKLGRLMAARK